LAEWEKGKSPKFSKVITVDKIMRARSVVNEIYMDPKVEDYIIALTFATREPEKAGQKELKDLIAYGASPRATLFLAQVARAHAFIRGRGYVTPEDIKSVAWIVHGTACCSPTRPRRKRHAGGHHSENIRQRGSPIEDSMDKILVGEVSPWGAASAASFTRKKNKSRRRR